MKVQLIAHTPNPEQVIAAASRLCYSAAGLDALFDKLTGEKAAAQVEMLAQMGHESPMEHVSFTFGVEGVSRSLLAQLTRHRIASYSVQSQRYVEESGQFDYILPPEIEADPQAKAEFTAAMEEISAHYHHLAEVLYQRHLNRMEAQGMPRPAAQKAARKQAIEDARYVLPNACDTKLLVTMNARILLNFFHHRCCGRAQWEIRQLAEEMFRLVYAVAPTLFQNGGPSCIGGHCPEGRMSCGRMAEMQALYAGIKNSRQSNG